MNRERQTPPRPRWVKSPSLAASLVCLVALAGTIPALPSLTQSEAKLAAGFVAALPGWTLVVLEMTTFFGTLSGAALLVVPAVIFLVMLGRRYDAVLVSLSLLVNVFSRAGKLLVARARPTSVELGFEPIDVGGWSFPSGHTALAVAVCSILALMLIRYERRSWMVWSGSVGLGLLAASVGLSRVTLGAHFPTDIFGGVMLGLAWVALLWSLPLGRDDRQDISDKEEAGTRPASSATHN